MAKDRKQYECEKCGRAVFKVKHLGEKYELDVGPVQGFIFIQDEYGKDVGTVETSQVHLMHGLTCGTKGQPYMELSEESKGALEHPLDNTTGEVTDSSACFTKCEVNPTGEHCDAGSTLVCPSHCANKEDANVGDE